MRYKILVLLTAFILLGNVAHAETVSHDNTFVEGDQYGGTFMSRVNRNFTQSANSINNIRGLFSGSLPTSGQILDGTIGIDNMADEADPAIRLTENFSEYVESGFTIPTDTDLTVDIAAGTAYPEGYRVVKASATTKTFTASRDTYVDIDKNGDFQYSEVANGAAAPAVATNSVRIAKVSTDGTQVATVTDLRKLTLVPEGQHAAVDGLKLTYVTGDQITVSSGRARDDDSNFRMILDATTTLDIDTSGLNGIDTGSKAASTWYRVFIIGASDDSQNVGVIASVSSTPTLPANYNISRRIGTFRLDGVTQIVSFDQVGIGSARWYHYHQYQSMRDGAGPTSWTDLDLSNAVSPVSTFARISLRTHPNGVGGFASFRKNGTLGNGSPRFEAGDYQGVAVFEIPTDTSQVIEEIYSSGVTPNAVDVIGYIDEV